MSGRKKAKPAKAAPDVAKDTATQFEVALIQLKTAIWIFFQGRDYFSVYTLARNAEEIISKIAKETGGTPAWDQIKDEVAPENRCKFSKSVDGIRNALKHYKFAREERIELPHFAVETFLFCCVQTIAEQWPQTFKSDIDFQVYRFWCVFHYPDGFQDEFLRVVAKDFPARERRLTLSKPEFYQEMSESVARPLLKNSDSSKDEDKILYYTFL
jgi:hypothetical protein